MIKVRPHHSMSWFVVGIHSDGLHVVVFPCLRRYGYCVLLSLCVCCGLVDADAVACVVRACFLHAAGFVGLVCSIVCHNWIAHFGRASLVGLVCSIVCRNWFAACACVCVCCMIVCLLVSANTSGVLNWQGS